MRQRRSEQKRFSENQIWHWAHETTLAVQYLHKKSILHRDIKSLNIFLTKTNRIKVSITTSYSYKYSR
jgi:serine/threonine protein kinase